ncbi:hypothetical protein DPMN_074097 [Dreissena polymorpha]|uniref:Uncharacterized protein n=1 Tax=Dreissena polymorpha TaxID=45954 RepID=A0A9D3YHZ8_DREPO|nr:hypothetical protein DPMN_074097 [Dreissena polymorpha]
MTSRVLTRTNVLTKFHADWNINVTPRENCCAPCRPYIIGTNNLTTFHEDWTINVTSRVLTRFHYSHIKKTAPPPRRHFHEDQTINVAVLASRLLTRQEHRLAGADRSSIFFLKVKGLSFSITKEGGCGGVLVICEMGVGTGDGFGGFHDDWAINMASRVLTRQMFRTHKEQQTTEKKAITKPHHEHIAISWRKQTNQQTDQQTGQKQYVPHYYMAAIIKLLTKFGEDIG